MKVYAVQFDIAWEDKPANRQRIETLLAAAHPEPGSLVVLPEMFSTGFSLRTEVTRQDAARSEEGFLAGLAQRFGVTITGSLITAEEGGRARNEAQVWSPEKQLLARYVKQRPFSGGGEAAVHEPGTALATFPWQGFTVAPFICYDLRFPELFREAVRAGANLLVVMALWPSRRVAHWVTLLQARAIENQAWVVGVNRIGTEPELPYSGRSLVVNPHGEIIADAQGQERVLAAELSLEQVQAWRRDFPALRDAGLWPRNPGA